MISNDVGQRLHDRSTRGEALSAEEQAMLADWYRQLDEEDAKTPLSLSFPPDLEKLREEHRRILDDLVESAKRIKAKEMENERLREEIAKLRQALAERRARQPA